MYHKLKQQVYDANMALQRHGLVVFTWGNVSGIDRDVGVVAIKPSGVRYEDLTPESIVVLDLKGNVVEGDLRPSSDTPTHLELYRCFEGLGGICHTHSTHATMWAQAQRDIPCLGTTHADHFYGPIPVTAPMTVAEIEQNYEANTGKVIVRRFEGLDPMQMPAVLVANHGPFTWGDSAAASVKNAVVLEEVAKMAHGALVINSDQKAIAQTLLDKHYLRKHGENAYYGQA
ncbi:MAG: L-ribulose-5-phosphate 4-epimerase [Phycisphaerales bacterium]|nr:MAG: L-ribulose-5-phosphate 4-epimerase [Phycisphaerales bacterium]